VASYLPVSQDCPAVLGEEPVSVLLSPWAVILAQHRADGVDHPLGVSGIQVEPANRLPALIGDREGRLDRTRRDALGLEPQAVQREGERGLRGGLPRRGPAGSSVMPGLRIATIAGPPGVSRRCLGGMPVSPSG
jgi:hypothetical protein